MQPKWAICGEPPSQASAVATAARRSQRERRCAANPSSPASIQGQKAVVAAKFQWMTWTVCLAPSAKSTAASSPEAGERPRSRIQAAMPQPAMVRWRSVARVSARGASQGRVSQVVGAKTAACGSATSG